MCALRMHEKELEINNKEMIDKYSITKKMGILSKLKQNPTEKVGGDANSQNQFFTPEEGRALMMGITLSVEARYAAVTRLLKESGYKSMLDIASGYTPRVLMCQKEGVDYVGIHNSVSLFTCFNSKRICKVCFTDTC